MGVPETITKRSRDHYKFKYMKLPLFSFIFLAMLFFSTNTNAQTDKWWLDSQVCDNSETYHCCCYSPSGV